MSIAAMLIQMISGAVGGNIAAALLKKLSLGRLGNSLVGILGGGLGGSLLALLGALGMGAAAAGATGLDIRSIVSSVAGGGVGGGVLLAIVGAIRAARSKSS